MAIIQYMKEIFERVDVLFKGRTIKPRVLYKRIKKQEHNIYIIF